jgi:hypothetical protein
VIDQFEPFRDKTKDDLSSENLKILEAIVEDVLKLGGKGAVVCTNNAKHQSILLRVFREAGLRVEIATRDITAAMGVDPRNTNYIPANLPQVVLVNKQKLKLNRYSYLFVPLTSDNIANYEALLDYPDNVAPEIHIAAYYTSDSEYEHYQLRSAALDSVRNFYEKQTSPRRRLDMGLSRSQIFLVGERRRACAILGIRQVSIPTVMKNLLANAAYKTGNPTEDSIINSSIRILSS